MNCLFITLLFYSFENVMSKNEENNLNLDSLKFKFEREEIKIGGSTFLSNNMFFNFIENNNFIESPDNLYLPSDIVTTFLSGKSFDLLITQGYTNEEEFIDLTSNNIEKVNSVLDNFGNIAQNGASYYSENFSPIYDKVSFESFFESFSGFFQIQSSPYLDRTNYMINEDPPIFYLNELIERPCSEILDGIKNIFPKFRWKEFSNYIDYDKISNSSFKSILFKISKEKVKNSEIFRLNIRVLYKINESKKMQTSLIIKSKRTLSGNHFGYDPYLLENIIEINPLLFENLEKLNVIEFIPFQLQVYYNSPLIEVFLVKYKKVNKNIDFFISSNTNRIRHANIYTKIDLQKRLDLHEKIETYSKFDIENLDYISNISFKIQEEEQNSNISYTYESKSSNLVKHEFNLGSIKDLLLLNLLKNHNDEEYEYKIRIKTSLKLKKVLMNFESWENEMEFGYRIPCGLILLERKEKKLVDNLEFSKYIDKIFVNNNKIISTNQVAFNIPVVDNTTPFTIIAFTWVIFGFICIQMINRFLNASGGILTNIILTIKDKLGVKLQRIKIIFEVCCCPNKKSNDKKEKKE